MIYLITIILIINFLILTNIYSLAKNIIYYLPLIYKSFYLHEDYDEW